MSSDALANLMLSALKDQLDGGFLYIFAGPVPADADDALDMGADHTQVIALTNNNDGITGLTFDAPVGGILSKAASEDWVGTVTFDGADGSMSTLAPTFYRFCASSDDGRSAGGLTPRLQGTVGGPASSARIKLDTDTVTANGSNTKGLSSFVVTAAQAY